MTPGPDHPDDPGDRLRIDGTLEIDRRSRHVAFYPFGKAWPPMFLDTRSVTGQMTVEALLADLPELRGGEDGDGG